LWRCARLSAKIASIATFSGRFGRALGPAGQRVQPARGSPPYYRLLGHGPEAGRAGTTYADFEGELAVNYRLPRIVGFALVCSSGLMLPFAASADDNSGWYAGAQLGFGLSSSQNLNNSGNTLTNNYGSGFAGGVQGGYSFANGWRPELEIKHAGNNISMSNFPLFRDPWAKREAWRKSPVFSNRIMFRNLFPGFGIAVVAFTVYVIADNIYLKARSLDSHHH